MAVRILHDRTLRTGARAMYWNAAALSREIAQVYGPENRAFRRHAHRDIARYLLADPRPVSGESERRARAAVDWILSAQSIPPDDGVSLGYFPCRSAGSPWQPSYPETTGYIITSLLDFARCFDDVAARDAALRMARWEASVQMPSGAVQGGPVVPPDRQTPAAFNTGMVLDGWCSAITATGDAALISSARRGADFLVADLDDAGYYRTNGEFVTSGEIKTYTCLCAWALHRFSRITGEARYAAAALRSVEAAVRQQQTNGWFAHNCLTRSEAPLTHTLGYTLQAILEVGSAEARDDLVAAVERSMSAILPSIRASGYLPGRFYADWTPAAFSSCLTGSAQIAIVGYRLFEVTGKAGFRDAADRLLDFLKALQELDAEDKNVNGALAGSFPLFGEYMRGGYPNWATKYLIDALMLQLRVRRANSPAADSRSEPVSSATDRRPL